MNGSNDIDERLTTLHLSFNMIENFLINMKNVEATYCISVTQILQIVQICAHPHKLYSYMYNTFKIDTEFFVE